MSFDHCTFGLFVSEQQQNDSVGCHEPVGQWIDVCTACAAASMRSFVSISLDRKDHGANLV